MLESFLSPNPVTILKHLHWIINSWKAKDFSFPPSPGRWGNTPASTKSMHDFRIFNVLFPYKLGTKFHESSKISPKQKRQWLEPNQRKHITRSKGRITQIIVDKEPETVSERTASWSQEAISLALNLAFPATAQKGTDNSMSLSWLPLTRCIYSPWSGTLANTNIHNLNILSGFFTACDRHVLRSLVCLHLQYSSFTHRRQRLSSKIEYRVVLYFHLKGLGEKYQASFRPIQMLAKSYSLCKSNQIIAHLVYYLKVHLHPHVNIIQASLFS